MNASNQLTIQIITGTIAFLAVLCVASICVLAFKAMAIPPELNTIAGGLVGAVTTMLVKTTPTGSIPEVKDQPTKP